MPKEQIKGEIQVQLVDSINFIEVPHKTNLYVKLKRTSYMPSGGAPKDKYLVKICSRFNQREQGDISQKLPITGMNNEDKNLQSDTLTCEFYMKADKQPKDEGATFIGECYIPYKKCFNEDNVNEWVDYQCVL